jgi:hypothetical protein
VPFYPGERIEAKILCNATTQLFRSLYLDVEEYQTFAVEAQNFGNLRRGSY